MIKLSPRLQTIADFVEKGQSLADIGTDHGFLPLFLTENNISPKVVLSDINTGPLEKAAMNIARHCPGKDFDLRLGSGISTIAAGEVDVIVIAGMGGLLIADIMGEDPLRSGSYKKFILQPRNAQDKLRMWLLHNDFSLCDERLVREGKFICEIVVAEPNGQRASIHPNNGLFQRELDFEISPILFQRKDPLLTTFIKNKISTEIKIATNLLKSAKEDAEEKRNESIERICLLEGLMERSISHERKYE